MLYDLFPYKQTTFGDCDNTAPYLRVTSLKTQILGAHIDVSILTLKIQKPAYYQNCYQILFLVGPNGHKTNQVGEQPPFWKNRLITISQQWFDQSTQNLARWRLLNLLPCQVLKCFYKIQEGQWPPFWNWLNHHISATVQPIVTKFGTVMQTDPLNPTDR